MISIKTPSRTPKSLSESSQHPLIRNAIMSIFSRNIKSIMMGSVIASESLSRLHLPIQTPKCKSTKFWHTMLFLRKNLNICNRKIINSKCRLTHKKHKSKSLKQKTNHWKLPSRKSKKPFFMKSRNWANWLKSWLKWKNKKQSIPFMRRSCEKKRSKTKSSNESCKRYQWWTKPSKSSWRKVTRRSWSCKNRYRRTFAKTNNKQ